MIRDWVYLPEVEVGAYHKTSPSVPFAGRRFLAFLFMLYFI